MEESAKAQKSVFAVLPMMLVLILTILMMQLHSFQRLFLVHQRRPVRIDRSGGCTASGAQALRLHRASGRHRTHRHDRAQFRDLIVQIDAEIAEGIHPWDAVIDATMHRFRPIMLTAAAAILGMIPIAPTVFWSPMAYAIMGGLAVATVLTLLFLPALYVIWFRVHEPAADTTKPALAAAAS